LLEYVKLNLGEGAVTIRSLRFCRLFSLPIEIRREIYKDVLAVLHLLYLCEDDSRIGYPVRTFGQYHKPPEWPQLIYTNRQIHDEAKAVLYDTIDLIVEDVETEHGKLSLLRFFWNRIGHVNAGLLSNLRINFPATERIEGQSGGIRLSEYSLQSLQLLKNDFTHLKTLIILVYTRDAYSLLLDNLNDIKPAKDLLLELDAQVRGIVSLRKIMIRFCVVPPDPWAREFVEQLGWEVDET
jgi:hypothetical protein